MGSDFALRARELAEAPAIPPPQELAALVAETRSILDAEDPELRPRDSSGKPGGLVLLPPSPALLLPDLHARPAFLARAFEWMPRGREAPSYGERLCDLLASGGACLLCLGDLFHSEASGARSRWKRAYREFASGWASRESMDEEMALSLSTARIVLEAKRAFPLGFHYIKGNHDNIADEEGRGDHSFFKFAVESEMVASWFRLTYGERLLWEYRELELALPIAALGRSFVATHGEPAFALDRRDIVEYRSRPDVVDALIWTPNGGAEEGSVERSLDALLGHEAAIGARWFAGHRPVDGRFATRAGGRFVQFHDPESMRGAYLLPDRDPDPARDIVDI